MKSSYLRRAAMVIATAGLIGAAPLSQGNDTATVLQYELGLGGKRPVSSFYLGYQSTDLNSSGPFAAGGSLLRIPLYSTDSGIRTTSSTFSAALRTAPSEKTTVGDVLAGLAAITLYVGLPLYALAKQLEEAYEVDLSGIEYPDIDPELLGLAPQNADGTHEQQ